MRILEICTAKSLGGLELYFDSCCKHLTSRGHNAKAVVSSNSKLHSSLMAHLPCIEIHDGLWNSFWQLRKEIRSFQPEIIHVHHKTDLLLASLLKKFSGIKFMYVHTRQMDLPGRKKNIYHSFIYRSIDLLIAITDRLKNQILSNTSIDPIRVTRLYYGVPSIKHNQSRCNDLIKDKGVFNVGVVARIDNKKEQHVIIESLKILNDKKVHLHLIGDSTDDVYYQNLLKLISEMNLTDQVFLHGFVKHPQEIMACFDLIVLTTGIETFGLVLPEAMRSGVAVVGANGGGVPEIIDDNENGLLFEAGNPTSLASCLTTMMDPNTRKKYAEKGKIKADSQFEIEHHFNELEKLLS
jgi:L-malate glycosyltransferase